MTEKQLTAKMEQYVKLAARADEIKKKMELLTAQINTEMTERETDILELNGITAKRADTKTHRFDSKSFKADNPELYESYYIEATRHSFTIKANKLK